MTSIASTPNRLLTPADFSYSPSFASVLAGLRSSLLATTYQAGQLVSFGTHGDELQLALEPFSVGDGDRNSSSSSGGWFARFDLDDETWRARVGSVAVAGGQV